jgi:hypothetical protein
MRRQLTPVLASLALVAGLATSGCDPAPSTPERTAPASPATPPASPATPKDQLLAAVPDGSEGSFRYTFKDAESQGSGVVDPAGKKLQHTAVYKDRQLGFTMTISFVVVDQESWMKVAFAHTENVTGLPKLPKKWMHIDRSKVKDDAGAELSYADPDPAGAASLFRSAVDVRPAGTGGFRGTLDLTGATDSDLIGKDTVTALGEKAKSVPFRATVDRTGRLTSLSLDVPAAGKTPATTYRVSYADYGSAPPVTQPAAKDVQEAPATAYDLING